MLLLSSICSMEHTSEVPETSLCVWLELKVHYENFHWGKYRCIFLHDNAITIISAWLASPKTHEQATVVFPLIKSLFSPSTKPLVFFSTVTKEYNILLIFFAHWPHWNKPNRKVIVVTWYRKLEAGGHEAHEQRRNGGHFLHSALGHLFHGCRCPSYNNASGTCALYHQWSGASTGSWKQKKTTMF